MTSMRILRWVLVALSLALGVVLIARGNVVVGALIGAMAATRGLLFFRMQQRRTRLRQHIARRRGYPV